MTEVIPIAFRGLRWEPTNEQEVVVLFGRLLDCLKEPLAIEFVQTGFPDCKATDSETGKEIWIEFELYSSHFYRDHSKRPEKCDKVICWHDDLNGTPPSSWDKSREPPKIVALDDIVGNLPQNAILNRRRPGVTQEEYFRSRILGLSPHHQDVIRRLLKFSKAAGLQVDWPPTNGACFTIRMGTIECFKVGADGKIGTPFSRWKGRVAPAVTSRVVRELNKALGNGWFSATGKISVDISQALPDQAAIRKFIDVWSGFARATKHLQPSAAGTRVNRRG